MINISLKSLSFTIQKNDVLLFIFWIAIFKHMLQIICKGIYKLLLKTFLKKIISLFLLVKAFINSYFLPAVENTEHEFINKENLK